MFRALANPACLCDPLADNEQLLMIDLDTEMPVCLP